MGRVEEAINVVHLLADKANANNDRRRVFPLVVSDDWQSELFQLNDHFR